jgi:hypothetical protein
VTDESDPAGLPVRHGGSSIELIGPIQEFLAKDTDIRRGFDSNADHPWADRNDLDGNVQVGDENFFAEAARKN